MLSPSGVGSGIAGKSRDVQLVAASRGANVPEGGQLGHRGD